MEHKEATCHNVWHFLVFYDPFGGVKRLPYKRYVVRTSALSSDVRFWACDSLYGFLSLAYQTIMVCYSYYSDHSFSRNGYVLEEQNI